MLLITTAGCNIATVRSLEEDEEAKKGFVVTEYVDQIWEGAYRSAITERAVAFEALMALIDADENAAIAAHGSRSGSGAFSFVTQGEARVLEVNTESRIGFMTLDVAPYDGNADASMAIGPVIRGRDTSLRDAVGFINFNDFTNQTEFAQVSDAMKTRVLETVLGAIDLETIQGQTIRFYGTFMLSDRNNLEIVPVTLEVIDS
ncbi:MAG: DUF2291 domain-containing protein [Anaerolineae bacterium]|nr:DUF2291 domain-containing protein [Anaerolineae bacterium]